MTDANFCVYKSKWEQFKVVRFYIALGIFLIVLSQFFQNMVGMVFILLGAVFLILMPIVALFNRLLLKANPKGIVYQDKHKVPWADIDHIELKNNSVFLHFRTGRNPQSYSSGKNFIHIRGADISGDIDHVRRALIELKHVADR